MRHCHRLLTFVACFLAVAMLTGSALPSPWQWTCHHATRLVAASLHISPAAMPCRMTSAPMPAMACCAAPQAKRVSFARESIGRPGCQPTLSPLAPVPALQASDTHAQMRRNLAGAVFVGSLPKPAFLPAPVCAAERQRPPPRLRLPGFVCPASPTPRGPPVA